MEAAARLVAPATPRCARAACSGGCSTSAPAPSAFGGRGGAAGAGTAGTAGRRAATIVERGPSRRAGRAAPPRAAAGGAPTSPAVVAAAAALASADNAGAGAADAAAAPAPVPEATSSAADVVSALPPIVTNAVAGGAVARTVLWMEPLAARAVAVEAAAVGTALVPGAARMALMSAGRAPLSMGVAALMMGAAALAAAARARGAAVARAARKAVGAAGAEESCGRCRRFGIVKCSCCNGNGVVTFEGKFVHGTPCPLCFGKRYEKCDLCGGHRRPHWQAAKKARQIVVLEEDA